MYVSSVPWLVHDVKVSGLSYVPVFKAVFNNIPCGLWFCFCLKTKNKDSNALT